MGIRQQKALPLGYIAVYRTNFTTLRRTNENQSHLHKEGSCSVEGSCLSSHPLGLSMICASRCVPSAATSAEFHHEWIEKNRVRGRTPGSTHASSATNHGLFYQRMRRVASNDAATYSRFSLENWRISRSSRFSSRQLESTSFDANCS